MANGERASRAAISGNELGESVVAELGLLDPQVLEELLRVANSTAEKHLASEAVERAKRRSVSRARLQRDLAAAFEVTGNPLYAWFAVAAAVDQGERLPDFALSYLGETAGRILAIGEEPPTDMPRAIQRALGFTVSKAPSAWSEICKRADDNSLTLEYLRRASDVPGRARAVATTAGVSSKTVNRAVERTLSSPVFGAQYKREVQPLLDAIANAIRELVPDAHSREPLELEAAAWVLLGRLAAREAAEATKDTT
jgi:hypothetical protein